MSEDKKTYELHTIIADEVTIEPLVPVPVERLRAWLALAQERDHQAGWRPADAADPLVTALRDAVIEIWRLRAGLEGLRIEHAIGREEGCVGWCDCGADEHNARLDALLVGTGVVQGYKDSFVEAMDLHKRQIFGAMGIPPELFDPPS
jgi:hypothetical protein